MENGTEANLIDCVLWLCGTEDCDDVSPREACEVGSAVTLRGRSLEGRIAFGFVMLDLEEADDDFLLANGL